MAGCQFLIFIFVSLLSFPETYFLLVAAQSLHNLYLPPQHELGELQMLSCRVGDWEWGLDQTLLLDGYVNLDGWITLLSDVIFSTYKVKGEIPHHELSIF